MTFAPSIHRRGLEPIALTTSLTSKSYSGTEGNSTRYISRWERLDYAKQQTGESFYNINAWRYYSEYSLHMYGWLFTASYYKQNNFNYLRLRLLTFFREAYIIKTWRYITILTHTAISKSCARIWTRKLSYPTLRSLTNKPRRNALRKMKEKPREKRLTNALVWGNIYVWQLFESLFRFPSYQNMEV